MEPRKRAPSRTELSKKWLKVSDTCRRLRERLEKIEAGEKTSAKELESMTKKAFYASFLVKKIAVPTFEKLGATGEVGLAGEYHLQTKPTGFLPDAIRSIQVGPPNETGDALKIAIATSRHVELSSAAYSRRLVNRAQNKLFSPSELTEAAAASLQAIRGVKPTTVSQPSLVKGDPALFYQAVHELLENARKSVAANHDDASKRRILVKTSVNSRGELVASVADNGVGIDFERPELGRRVWQMFFTDSSGFGLPMVKENVARLGGRFEVASKLGKGAVFKIILPNARRA